MAKTIADVMVTTLKASGVRRVYGIPGDTVNGFMDALAGTARSPGSTYGTRRPPGSPRRRKPP